MLKSIAIQDFILIDKVLLDFFPGMTVITGETGAGKSLLLSAIEFALGMKTDSKVVRQGCDCTVVAVEFSDIPDCATNLLQESGITIDDSIVIRRTLFADGKSKIFINDLTAGAKLAQSIGSVLLEVHGQWDSILDPKTQLIILDQFSGTLNDKSKISDLYLRKIRTENEFTEVNSCLESAIKEQDYIKSCVRELEAANLHEDEEAGLIQLRQKIKNNDKLLELISQVEDLCTIDSLLKAQKLVTKAVDIRPDFHDLAVAIEAALAAFDEVEVKLDILHRAVNLPMQSLDQVEDRLMCLRDLARKHSCNINHLPQVLMDMKFKVLDTDNLIQRREVLKSELDLINKRYDELASTITAKRKKAASELSSEVNGRLSLLRLFQCKFIVSLEDSQIASATGKDVVNFLVSTNLKQPFTKIEKVASGGEAARIMLAIKAVMANAMNISTFVFDEIDSGTGGAAASAIGSMLESMSHHKQVLAITHSPQVAVYAKNHLYVEKTIIDDHNITEIKYISGDDRINAVARMLASSDKETDEACSAAKKLFSSISSKL